MPSRATTPRTEPSVRQQAGVPPTPRTWVPRPDLAARLDEALEGPLTLVVAPAGTGKTSGLAAWCHAHPDVAVTWVPSGAALQHDRLADLLDGDEHAVLVVDDAHLLPTPVVHRLEEWLDGGAAGPRLVLLCRWDPPISRLVPTLRGQLATLRGDALQLPEAQARALVAAHAPGLAPEQVDLITEVAHGWAAVLALAARTVAGAQDPASAARRLTETGTGVTDLIASQVFATLGDRTRHLLLCLADEGLVEPGTAERLTGDPRAGELLGELADSGLLVTRRDDAAQDASVFAVHPLLAEVTRRRIRAGGVAVAQARATIRRAARADVTAGRVAPGLRRLVAAGAWDDAVAVMDEQGDRLLMQVPSDLLRRVVEAAPDQVAGTAGACVTMVLDRWVHADFSAASDWIRRLESLPQDSVRGVDRALVGLLCARLGGQPPAEAVEAARLVVDSPDFRPASPVLAGWLLTELGVAETWIGDLGPAESHLRWAAAVAEPISRRLHAGALSQLAQTTYLLGDHANAAALAARAADGVLATGLGTDGPVATVLSRARVVQALATSSLGEPTEEVQDQIAAGDPVSALSDPMTSVLRDLYTARRFLESGELEEAASWLEMCRALPPMPAYVRVLVLAERAVVAGSSGDRRGLDEVRDELVALGAVTEAAIVDAARASSTGDAQGAAAALVPAGRGDLPHVLRESPLVALVYGAQLAHPGGPRDLDWSVDGTPARVLLSRAGGAARWVRLLVDLGSPHDTGPRAVPLPSPDVPAHVPRLTAREREVLAHLGRGSTYADIAESLVVSENTVKTHVSSVYAKLGAGRRSQALKIARALGLA